MEVLVIGFSYEFQYKTNMFNLEKFIADSVTFRPRSMFEADIEANRKTLTREIRGKKVCVIGGGVHRFQFHQGRIAL